MTACAVHTQENNVRSIFWRCSGSKNSPPPFFMCRSSPRWALISFGICFYSFFMYFGLKRETDAGCRFLNGEAWWWQPAVSLMLRFRLERGDRCGQTDTGAQKLWTASHSPPPPKRMSLWHFRDTGDNYTFGCLLGWRSEREKQVRKPWTLCLIASPSLLLCMCGRKGHDKSLTFVPINNNLVVHGRRQTQNTLLKLQTRHINECTVFLFFFLIAENSDSKQTAQQTDLFLKSNRQDRLFRPTRSNLSARASPDLSAWVAVVTV